MRKCYYEVLGVEKNASSSDIKKAYRRLALQMHPDKNPDREEDAKLEFQALQKAYEVLSNPQERAWYDEHWRTILREGIDGEFEEFDIDIMSYCTSSCYNGFHDDEGGYYAVYRDLFAKLTAEEIEAGWSDEHDEDIPNFGDSQSSYEEVVRPFYAFWEAFCTVKSFGWTDEYDTRRAGCRRIARLMEKENKKIRSAARQAWNREVRALVDFVKRKDKRVQAWKAAQEVLMKQKAEEAAKREQAVKEKQRAERKKILESAKKLKPGPENQSTLKDMEAYLSAEFGERISDQDSDEDSPTCFHCAACNKSFRSEKAFCNHEKSKKHLAQVERLREMMQEEDELFQSESAEEADEALIEEHHSPDEDEIGSNEESDNHVAKENSSEDEAVETITNGLKNATLDKPDEEHGEISCDNGSSENEDDSYEQQFLAKVTKKNKKSRNRKVSIEDPLSDAVDVDLKTEELLPGTLSNSDEKVNQEKLEKRKKRKAKNQLKKAMKPVEKEKVESASDEEYDRLHGSSAQSIQCAVCQAKFKSRSALFKHIESEKHAAPPDHVKAVAAEMTSKKQKKRKGKK